MEVISTVLTNEEIEKFKNTFYESLTHNNNPYIKYFFNLENCTVSIYTTNKAVFQGKDAKIYAATFLNQKEVISQVGSDEVGTGDFFGPVVVVAAIVDEKIYQKIKDFKIEDSKNINDEKILYIAENLIKTVPYTLLILKNNQYNEVIKTNNMNKIKARMHNQAYLNLIKKFKNIPKLKIIDQFANKELYFNYLKEDKEVVKDVLLETKAESKYISVAISSIIARYYFIKEIENMNQKYNFIFKKGAGSNVDDNISEFIEKFGFDELKNVGKMNFKNLNKIIK